MKMNCPHKVGRPAEWFIPPGTATHRGPMAAAAAPQVIYHCLETLSLLSGRSSCVLLVRAGSDSDAALFCLLQTQMSSENELIALENAGRCYICGQVYAPLPPARSACCWALTKRWRRVRSGHLSRDCPTLGGESKPATSTALATNVSTPANRLRLLLCVAGKRALRQSSVVLIAAVEGGLRQEVCGGDAADGGADRQRPAQQPAQLLSVESRAGIVQCETLGDTRRCRPHARCGHDITA